MPAIVDSWEDVTPDLAISCGELTDADILAEVVSNNEAKEVSSDEEKDFQEPRKTLSQTQLKPCSNTFKNIYECHNNVSDSIFSQSHTMTKTLRKL